MGCVVLQRFLSPDEVNFGRAFGLIEGWEVGGNIGIDPSEIRLFDAPIVNGFSVPRIRFREVSYSQVVTGTFNRQPSEKVFSIRKGWLFATDSRFIMSQPKPPQPIWMSDDEYEQTVLTPIFLEAAGHSITGLLLHAEFPHSGLLDAITIIGAPSNLERLFYAGMVQQRNQGGNEFVSSFYYFLNAIADKNRYS
jgi:hypothetical protein